MIIRLLLISLVSIFSEVGYGQDQRMNYGYLSYNCPQNWKVAEPITIKGGKTFGCQFFDHNKFCVFTIIETPNNTSINDAYLLKELELKNIVLNTFNENANFGIIQNKIISGIHCKYVKAKVITSSKLDMSSLNLVFFFNQKMFIITGIYNTQDEVEYYPILNNIINSIKLK